MCYPSDNSKINWDIFMTFVLLLTCVLTPLHIAFSDEDNEQKWMSRTNNVIDILFFIDMIVIFNSAFYDEESFTMNESYKEIACAYLKGWFLIVLISILPFDLFQRGGAASAENDVNGLVRFMKIGRLYKLIKLTKLMRILNIVADRRSILKYLQQLL